MNRNDETNAYIEITLQNLLVDPDTKEQARLLSKHLKVQYGKIFHKAFCAGMAMGMGYMRDYYENGPEE